MQTRRTNAEGMINILFSDALLRLKPKPNSLKLKTSAVHPERAAVEGLLQLSKVC